MGEQGKHFTNSIYDMNIGKRIVYRNTRCADLYARDNIGQAPRRERQIIVSAAREVAVAPTCGCKMCGQPVLKRRYVIVPE